MVWQSIQEIFIVRTKIDEKCNVATSTYGGLHGSDVTRWNLFRPLSQSVVTYRPVYVKKYYLLWYSTVRLVWIELVEWNITLMYSDQIGFRLFYCSISLAATEGTCKGLWCSSKVFSNLVTLSLHRVLPLLLKCSSALSMDRKRWFFMFSDTIYMIHIVFYIIHKTRSYQGEGK